MDYSEFRKLLARTGLTLSAFAELLKMNRRSITNYAANGTVPDHLAMIAALIGNMADNGLDYRQVLEKVDIKKKKPRGSKRLALAERTNLMDSR
ncbi:XRE family transcriptional regulator [Xanthomonas campestris pv. incanae]|uniref:XRE family transcriptional regulator n=1 Tax=Xanthomonas campestris TaxID=339 RepID=UPI002368202C|nr:XRE family transcriptional regulator [Xanthomonas campestris]WDJ98486.1 XRE family transcriptional regulator [Xanthomonas campestris pv. incanae]